MQSGVWHGLTMLDPLILLCTSHHSEATLLFIHGENAPCSDNKDGPFAARLWGGHSRNSSETAGHALDRQWITFRNIMEEIGSLSHQFHCFQKTHSLMMHWLWIHRLCLLLSHVIAINIVSKRGAPGHPNCEPGTKNQDSHLQDRAYREEWNRSGNGEVPPWVYILTLIKLLVYGWFWWLEEVQLHEVTIRCN